MYSIANINRSDKMPHVVHRFHFLRQGSGVGFSDDPIFNSCVNLIMLDLENTFRSKYY